MRWGGIRRGFGVVDEAIRQQRQWQWRRQQRRVGGGVDAMGDIGNTGELEIKGGLGTREARGDRYGKYSSADG